MIVKWNGKEVDKNKTKSKSYMEAITKGVQRSIYYWQYYDNKNNLH